MTDCHRRIDALWMFGALMTVVVPVLGGSCWQTMLPDGRCVDPILHDVTREECCRSRFDRQMFWLEEDVDIGTIYYIKWFGTGIPGCKPCHGSCKTMKCTGSKQCKMVIGSPRCVCRPDCSELTALRLDYTGPLRSHVCGDDGRTYSSFCSLLRYNCQRKTAVSVAYKGECQVQSCNNVSCTKKDNRCIVDQHNVPHCVTCSRHCPSASEPVCGSDGRTYHSLCHLTQHNCLNGLNVVLQHSGECNAHSSCNEKTNCILPALPSKCVRLTSAAKSSMVCISCPSCEHDDHGSNKDTEDDGAGDSSDDTLPVCGTNNVTYSSQCLMQSAACHHGLYVRAQHAGPCGAEEKEIRAAIKRFYNPPSSRMVREYSGSTIITENKKNWQELLLSSAGSRRRRLRKHA